MSAGIPLIATPSYWYSVATLCLHSMAIFCSWYFFGMTLQYLYSKCYKRFPKTRTHLCPDCVGSTKDCQINCTPKFVTHEIQTLI